MAGRVCPAAQARTAGGVDYTLTRRRVRNLNLRVRADGSVAVSAPARVPLAAVDAFVAAHAAWVASAVGRAQARRAAEAAEVLPPKAEALARMQALCAAYYPLFAASCPGGRMPRIAVRDMNTRWGSCSLRTGTLGLCAAAVRDAAARAGICRRARILPLCPPRPQPRLLGGCGRRSARLPRPPRAAAQRAVNPLLPHLQDAVPGRPPMSEDKKYATLVSNTILFAISNFSSKLVSLFIQPYLTYALDSPDVLGVTKMMHSVTNLLIPVVSLGVSFAVIRFGLDKTKDKASVFFNGFVTILTGFAGLLLFWPLVRMIPNAADYLVLLYLCVLASCLRTLCTQFIRARMRNRLVAIDGVLTTASLLGFYLLFLTVLNMGATGYLLALFCSDMCSAVFVFLAGGCAQYFRPRKFDKALWGEMLRYCVPMIPLRSASGSSTPRTSSTSRPCAPVTAAAAAKPGSVCSAQGTSCRRSSRLSASFSTKPGSSRP